MPLPQPGAVPSMTFSWRSLFRQTEGEFELGMAWMGPECSHPPYSPPQRGERKIVGRMGEGPTRGCHYGGAKRFCPGGLQSNHMIQNHVKSHCRVLGMFCFWIWVQVMENFEKVTQLCTYDLYIFLYVRYTSEENDFKNLYRSIWEGTLTIAKLKVECITISLALLSSKILPESLHLCARGNIMYAVKLVSQDPRSFQ